MEKLWNSEKAIDTIRLMDDNNGIRFVWAIMKYNKM